MALYLLQAACLAIFLVTGSLHALPDDVTITTSTTSGKVRGKVMSDGSSAPVAAFLGIPFAKPPTGALRFKPPVAEDPWTGTKDALHFGNACLQRPIPAYTFQVGDDPAVYDEDCLYLNVYTPLNSPNSTSLPLTSLPVMVWVHGGGYSIGSASMYPGKSLAATGVVLVTINYRLDVFGFLSTEDDVVPGNYGMLDQIAALKWVQKNIANFGGDPNMVTVFGESAGASGVSLLVLSPLSKGLFHRSIQESGSCLSSWGVEHPAYRISPAMAARLLGAGAECPDFTNSTNLLSCLQTLDSHRLLNMSLTLGEALGNQFFNVPRVETSYGFLPDLPINLLSRGEFNHVDTISGFNGEEMANMPQFAAVSTLEEARQAFYLPEFTELDKSRIAGLALSTFFNNVTADANTFFHNIVEAQDAFSFVGPALLELSMKVPKSQGKSHYLYEFRHRPSYQKEPKWATAFHGDELAFVFGVQEKTFTNFFHFQPDSADLSVSKQMMEMWSSFAKTGVPSSTAAGISWKTYSPSAPNYLEISENSALKMWSSPKVLSFFKKIVRITDIGDIQSGDVDILG